MDKSKTRARSYQDESVRAHPEMDRGYPVVIFGDHRFCAGNSLAVHAMPGPHMHSQVELNFVLQGSMTYWFDGRVLTLSAGRLALFWGMIPHQVTQCDRDTNFVVLYVPMAVFLELPTLSTLRAAIFRGAVVEALDIRSYDRDMFLRWREDLLQSDTQLEQIVRDELSARIRRLDREGWHDLREVSPLVPQSAQLAHDHDRAVRVEKMAQFIGEHALEDISAEDVARAASLHPNYAMSLFKRAIGLTIKQSITRQRLDTAQSMLIASDLPVASIAFDCGFGSLSSFYAAFEQRFHKSPAAFRQAYHRITRAA
jgi:AraC-like DNA-binding protein/mannose-6-phosphate isomerase-like protein (cupin superfamily)